MSKESDISIVMGSGNQGLLWANQHPPTCFAFDKNHIDNKDLAIKNYIRGHSLHLPFKDNSIDIIYSDFLLNALQPGDREAFFADLRVNPDLLASDLYPETVRNWYVDTIQKRFVPSKPHFWHIRCLLREAAINEMWRVLSAPGKIVIVDHDEVVKWVINRSPQILSSARYKPLMYTSEFCFSDYSRSNSLNKVIKDGARPKKVILEKRLSVEKSFK